MRNCTSVPRRRPWSNRARRLSPQPRMGQTFVGSKEEKDKKNLTFMALDTVWLRMNG